MDASFLVDSYSLMELEPKQTENALCCIHITPFEMRCVNTTWAESTVHGAL